jgi:hypothetical protein
VKRGRAPYQVLHGEKKSNYSAAIHQDGEKPVVFVPHFFSGASWLFAELAKTKA